MNFISNLFGKEKKQLTILLKEYPFDQLPVVLRYKDKEYHVEELPEKIKLTSGKGKEIFIFKSEFMNMDDILTQGKKLRDEFKEEQEKESKDVQKLTTLAENVISILGECNKLLENLDGVSGQEAEIGIDYQYQMASVFFDVTAFNHAVAFYMCAFNNGHPEQDECRMQMIWCLIELDDFYSAIKGLRDILEEDPKHILAWDYMARAYGLVGCAGKAGKCIVKVISLQQEPEEINRYYSILGDMLLQIEQEELGNYFLQLSENQDTEENITHYLEEVSVLFNQLAKTEQDIED